MDIRSWKAKSRQLRSEVYALCLGSKHPKTPWYAKAFTVLRNLGRMSRAGAIPID